MTRSAVTFVLGQENIGQEAAGNDHISGICFYGDAPGSFDTTAIQPVYSLSDAESKGIVNNYSDETKIKAKFKITAPGLEGNTLTLTVKERNPVTSTNPTGTTVVNLGTYTNPALAATADATATAVAKMISDGEYRHGYTAIATGSTVNITGRPGLGLSLNEGLPFSIAVTGSLTVTAIDQPETEGTGIPSYLSLWHYTVSEFFRANPAGVLWVGFFASVSSTFEDVVTLQNAADGACKQIGVVDFYSSPIDATTFTDNGSLLHNRGVEMFNQYRPAHILYAANISGITDLSLLENQQAKNNYYVTHVIQQDGAAVGAQLFINSGVSVTNIGNALGTISKAKVSQNIGEIGAFNITNDVEMAVPAFANGTRVSATPSNLLDQLDANRYLFATNMPNITGTYYNNDWSSIAQTNPYYRISRTRTMNKAIRLVYAAIVPLLKSQVELEPDGTITKVTLARFTGALLPVQTQMKNAGEVSNMRISISPTQDVLSSGKFKVGVAIQPTVSADFIEVNMSFTANI